MKAELVLMGRRVDMAPRVHRRTLVVLIYALFAACLGASWLIDHWSFRSMICVPAFVWPGAWILTRITRPNPGYLLDELELRWRDRAHYWSYRAMTLGAIILWILIFGQRQLQISERPWPMLAARHPWGSDNLLFGVATSLVFMAMTLPESLLLWFAPKMETPNEG